MFQKFVVSFTIMHALEDNAASISPTMNIVLTENEISRFSFVRMKQFDYLQHFSCLCCQHVKFLLWISLYVAGYVLLIMKLTLSFTAF